MLCPYEMRFLDDYADLMKKPDTHKYNYTKPKNQQEAEKRLRELSDYNYIQPKGRIELAIVEKSLDRYIGYIGFTGHNKPPWCSTEIFYTIHPAFFNRGYGTEAVEVMLDFGFRMLRFHRILAGATAKNTASWKIMEKLGMRRESHWIQDRPKYGIWHPENGFSETGEWDDGFGYAINADEYFSKFNKNS
jgi:[ribosomal protein S5]-alanine N-acetyltransferase